MRKLLKLSTSLLMFTLLILISGCVSYNVTAYKYSEEKGPFITCDKAFLKDEGGVCHDLYKCSDGKDHIAECWGIK